MTRSGIIYKNVTRKRQRYGRIITNDTVGGSYLNILFFLTPKAMCSYIDADATLRQAMERMEHSGYTALPVLDESGKYCGVVTEGDLLWTIKRLCIMDLRQTEEHSISEILHRRTVQPVRVDTRVEDLVLVAAEQNFVPVIDDKGDFIGIVTRSRILKYVLQHGFPKDSE